MDAPGTDYGQVTAIEAVNNGGQPEGPHSGIVFWQDKLNKGFRLTGVGGSDNHEPDYPASIPSALGHPTTVVYADNLSENAILAGIVAGHVFIDVDGGTRRSIEFSAKTGTHTASMGDVLQVPKDETATFAIRMINLTGAHPEIVHDTPDPMFVDEELTSFTYKSDGKRHWFRVDIRSVDGRLLIVGNPIYINWQSGS